jgi:hypothetical protein
MGSLLRQIALLAMVGLRSLSAHRAAAMVTVVSVASVAGVLVSLLAIREGTSIFRPQTARADEAIVLSSGAGDSSQSALSREALAIIAHAPGVRRGADGHPDAYASSMAGLCSAARPVQPSRGRFWCAGLPPLPGIPTEITGS